MFTQVVLLANGPDKLAKASMASLQNADAMASKISGWPARHPLRRILSNFVVLGLSEDPKIVSQVAENARKCVLETCNNQGLGSTAYPNQLGRYCESAQTKVYTRSNSKDNLRHSNKLRYITRQPSKGLDQRCTSDCGKKSQQKETSIQSQLSITVKDLKTSAANDALERVNKKSFSEDDTDLGPLSAQRIEHFAVIRLDDVPHQNSTASAVLTLKETDEIGILDRCRSRIEWMFAQELDWSPLPPVKHPLGPCQSRICWAVSTSIREY